jgi:hypothetical protein
VPEADDNLAPDVFDDTTCLNMELAMTCLNMELAMPRDGDGPDFARVTKRLRDKDGLPTGKAKNDNPILARGCTKSNAKMDTRHRLLQMRSQKTFWPKSMRNVTDTSCSKQQRISGQMDQNQCSKKPSSPLEVGRNAAERQQKDA